MPFLEAAELDTMQASAPESTDTEMYQALERELLICSDYQAGLVRNAAQALDEVTGRDMRSGQFREPAEEEEEEVPRTIGTRDKNRGRSILKKITANTARTATSTTPRQPHTPGDVPSGIGSPLTRHPSNHKHWGEVDLHSMPGYQALMKKSTRPCTKDIQLVQLAETVAVERTKTIVQKARVPGGAQTTYRYTYSVASAEVRPPTVRCVRHEEGTAQGPRRLTRP